MDRPTIAVGYANNTVENAATIGLDTEFVRMSTFHPKPGLIQIAADHDAFLIDPLADLDLKALGHALTGTTISILHAAQEDYEVLFKLTGSIPSPYLIHRLPMHC